MNYREKIPLLCRQGGFFVQGGRSSARIPFWDKLSPATNVAVLNSCPCVGKGKSLVPTFVMVPSGDTSTSAGFRSAQMWERGDGGLLWLFNLYPLFNLYSLSGYFLGGTCFLDTSALGG